MAWWNGYYWACSYCTAEYESSDEALDCETEDHAGVFGEDVAEDWAAGYWAYG